MIDIFKRKITELENERVNLKIYISAFEAQIRLLEIQDLIKEDEKNRRG